ncbi:molybdopterin-synthase adenylyltransferase MoeB [Pengzhenrongella sp.]|uniref:molybdopterin-synthase adenylyltransferase MoeB n=1 Tax=Pengzhenrongella sp. TaxID=2888820 RepID=UPI002F94324B
MTGRTPVPALVEPGPPLTATELERYSRHLLLPQLGDVGQRRLRNARVCVVGAGGLGAPVLLYLAAAGVGRIGIVDFDTVELTNLQRQVIHGQDDVGRAKVDSARDAMLAVDPELDVVVHRERLTAENVDGVLGGYDLVIDGTDNFPTRYLVNDACVRAGLPEVWGSVLRFDAQVSVFWGRPPPGSGVAPVELRDLFPAAPAEGSVPSCATGGVLGALCGQVGSIMATEAVKLITGIGEPLLGRVLMLDALTARWSELTLRSDPLRSACGEMPDDDGGGPHGGARQPVRTANPGARAVADGIPTVSPRELADRLAKRDGNANGDAKANGKANGDANGNGNGFKGANRDVDGEVDTDGKRLVLIDVREAAERHLASIAGSRSVPLGGILDGSALAALPRDTPIIAHCQSGARSEVAVRALRAAGFADVAHLAGGLLAWIDDVDPASPAH